MFLIVGCYNSPKDDKENLVFQEKPSPEENPQSSDSPSFAFVYNKVIEPKCLPCHSNQGGNKGHINLESPYANIYNQREIIFDEISSKSMPPRRAKSKLSQEEYDLIIYWLTQGAPEAGYENLDETVDRPKELEVYHEY